MPIDPNLIGNALAHWQQPEDSLARFAKLQALQSGVQQQRLQALQLQEGALGLQEKQQAQQDDQTFRQVLAQTGGDYTKAMPLLSGKISPQAQFNFQKSLTDYQKSLAEKSKIDLENLKSKNEMAAESLGIVANTEPADRPVTYQREVAKLQAKGTIGPNDLPAQYPGDDWIMTHRFMATPVNDQIDTALKQKADTRTQQTFDTTQPVEQAKALAQQIDAVKDQTGYEQLRRQLPPGSALLAQLPSAFDPATTPALIKRMAVPAQQQPEYDVAAAKAAAVKAFQQNPQAALDQLNQIIDRKNDPVSANAYTVLLQGAMKRGDYEAVNNILEQAGKQAASIGEKTDPRIISADAARAAATARATAPIQESLENYRNAMQQGDTASAKYYDSLTTARKAQATAQTIQRVIDLSRSNNPAASAALKALVPEFTNAVQDIKRGGGAQSAQLGSTWDRIASEANSALPYGKGLSDATLAQLEPYIKTVANGAVEQHNANVRALASAYPQKKFNTEPLPYNIQAQGAPGSYQADDKRVINGVTYVRDAKGKWNPQPASPK